MLPPPTQDFNDASSPVPPSDPSPVDEGQRGERERRSVARRLTPRLADGWAAVPDVLLEGFNRLTWTRTEEKEERHLRAIHLLVIAYLLSAKWDEKRPFVSAKYIAERSGASEKTILEAFADLLDAKLLKRERRKGQDSRRVRYEYDLTPLFERLEDIQRQFQSERARRRRPAREEGD